MPIASPTKLRIFIADDHAVVRTGLKLLINAEPDMTVIGEAEDGDQAWRACKELCPDVIVMDISMPKLNGAQATERIKVVCPQVHIIALSAYQDEMHVRQLLASGASGYVCKRTIAEDLSKAIRVVAAGGVHLDPLVAGQVVGRFISDKPSLYSADALTSREKEVLLQLAWGNTNKEIAEDMHLSVKTVEGYRARVMQKLDFKTRADLVRYAMQQGWMADE
jgi:DNA-binding NarL/FixJ family response regulator